MAAGQLDCPDCRGVLRPWGWARARSIYGLAGVLRPRRARCSACLITHVLLPVTVLVRREGPPPDRERAAGSGDTMRRWLRVLGGRLEPVRLHLLQVACRAGVDLAVPKALGCPWRRAAIMVVTPRAARSVLPWTAST